MKVTLWSLVVTAALSVLTACSAGAPVRSADETSVANTSTTPGPVPQTDSRPLNSAKIIHVLVALCDNEHQGIVPVPAHLGNGEGPERNLYWGAAYGVKSFFAKSVEWKLVAQRQNPSPPVLERCIFKNNKAGAYLIADAYRGAEIKKTIVDFLDYASGVGFEAIDAEGSSKHFTINGGAGADLIVFVGHNGLMDFDLSSYTKQKDRKQRGAIILCCASKSYFATALRQAGADPILWTNGLMAPEAYVLKAALDGWIANENGERIRARAAEAYNSYQHCGLKAARALFSSGW